MNEINIDDVRKYVEDNIHTFHDRRLASLADTNLKDLIKKKNPYLFRAKHIETAQELVESLLNAKLSSSEEEMIGDFLEGLAIFVAQKVHSAHKSGVSGFDFEYDQGSIHYFFTVKSGENWGNSRQWKGLELDCRAALKTFSTSQHRGDAKCMLGCCYGKSPTSLKRGIITQISGQNFWYLITGQMDFYKDIVKPIGYKAKQYNEDFNEKRAALLNKLTREFTNEFCDTEGRITWDRVVEFNSGNLNEDRFNAHV
jgi:hypothetical protein